MRDEQSNHGEDPESSSIWDEQINLGQDPGSSSMRDKQSNHSEDSNSSGMRDEQINLGEDENHLPELFPEPQPVSGDNIENEIHSSLPEGNPINASDHVRSDQQNDGESLQQPETNLPENRERLNHGLDKTNNRRTERTPVEKVLEKEDEPFCITKNFLKKIKKFFGTLSCPLADLLNLQQRSMVSIHDLGELIEDAIQEWIPLELLQSELFDQQLFNEHIDGGNIGRALRNKAHLSESQRRCLVFLFKQGHKIYFECIKNQIARIYQGIRMTGYWDEEAEGLFIDLQQRARERYPEDWEFFINRLQ